MLNEHTFTFPPDRMCKKLGTYMVLQLFSIRVQEC